MGLMEINESIKLSGFEDGDNTPAGAVAMIGH